jgi:hypothetical protein
MCTEKWQKWGKHTAGDVVIAVAEDDMVVDVVVGVAVSVSMVGVLGRVMGIIGTIGVVVVGGSGVSTGGRIGPVIVGPWCSCPCPSGGTVGSVRKLRDGRLGKVTHR